MACDPTGGITDDDAGNILDGGGSGDGDSTWELVFSDEFDDDVVDTEKWDISVSEGFAPLTAWGTVSNIYEENGNLVMPLFNFAEEHPDQDIETMNFGKKYKGSEIKTIMTFNRGTKFSARMKAAPGSGQLSNLFTYTEGEKNGVNYVNEIDYEIIADSRNHVSTNIWDTPADDLKGDHVTTRPDINTYEEFHQYDIIWLDAGIYFFVDEKLVRFEDKTNPDLETKFFMNHWMSAHGPSFGGIIDDSKVPSDMFVDWVRIYKFKEGGTEPEVPEPPKEPEVTIPESEWPTPAEGEALDGWNLVYRDNFDTLDETKWNKITTDAPSITTYGDESLAKVEDGKLVLTLQENPNPEDTANSYQGTKVTSVQKFQYGKLVARVKARADKGQFTTMDFAGSDIDGATNFIGYQTKTVNTSTGIELTDYIGSEADATSKSPAGADYSDYNEWSIEWSKDKIEYFFNGVSLHSTSEDVPAAALALSLSYWIGHWGDMNVGATVPGTAEVDWVRFYTKDPNATVTFDSNEGSPIASAALLIGEKLTEPAQPTKANARFDGWYTDETWATAWNFDNAVEDNMTLHAKWVIQYTVTFDMNEATSAAIETQVVDEGALATEPTDPVKTDWTFVDWFTTDTFDAGTEWNFTEDLVNANVTLYAKFIDNSIVSFTVTFKPNGAEGTDSTQIYVEGETKALSTNNFNRVGYTFGGWATAADSTEVAFTDAQSASFTDNEELFAIWNAILVDGISVKAKGPSIVVGEELQVVATVLPANALDTSVVWTSSDEGIASVDEMTGKVTGVGKGTAIIKATANGGTDKFAEISVSVDDAYTLTYKDEFASFSTDNWTYVTGGNAWGGGSIWDNLPLVDTNGLVLPLINDEGSIKGTKIGSKTRIGYGKFELRLKLPPGAGQVFNIQCYGENFQLRNGEGNSLAWDAQTGNLHGTQLGEYFSLAFISTASGVETYINGNLVRSIGAHAAADSNISIAYWLGQGGNNTVLPTQVNIEYVKFYTAK